MGKARFPKGSDEAKEYMAMIRQIAKEKREAIANGELEPIDKPKKEKKPKNVKEAIIFKAKEEEPIISEEEEEPEPVRKVVEPIVAPKQFTRKPKVIPTPPLEKEPEGVIEEQEPGVPAKKVQKPAKIVQEKPIIIKAPTKKVKKIIIQEEDEPEYEIEYRKAPAKQIFPEKKEKEVVNNLKDIPMDNPLLGPRIYRNK
jgi:hypothetical protein